MPRAGRQHLLHGHAVLRSASILQDKKGPPTRSIQYWEDVRPRYPESSTLSSESAPIPTQPSGHCVRTQVAFLFLPTRGARLMGRNSCSLQPLARSEQRLEVEKEGRPRERNTEMTPTGRSNLQGLSSRNCGIGRRRGQVLVLSLPLPESPT